MEQRQWEPTETTSLQSRLVSELPSETAQTTEEQAHQEGSGSDLEAALAQLQQDGRAQQRGHRSLVVGGMIYGAIAVALIIPMVMLKHPAVYSLLIAASGLLYGLMSVRDSFSMVRRMRRINRTAQDVKDADDLRFVGPMAQILAAGDGNTRKTAVATLKRLLPRLKASDAHLLNAEQRACLYKELDRCMTWQTLLVQNDEFTLIILKALEQIGDANALSHVERLATSVPRTEAQARVQEAARDCLPYLRQCAEQQEAQQTLLRSSSSLAAPSDTLLRPASGTTETDPQQLLRASHAAEHEAS